MTERLIDEPLWYHIGRRLSEDLDPATRRKGFEIARKMVWQAKRPYRALMGSTADLRLGRPQGRSWRSSLPRRVTRDLQWAMADYHYKHTGMIKNPLDMALYTLLINSMKPKTIVEIGSRFGGTAMWLADNSEALVYSIDITPPIANHPMVRFLQGDEAKLKPVLPWTELQHPLLIINDASHHYPLVLRCLEFLDTITCTDDYIIVEDSFLSWFGEDRRFKGGPARSIVEFLKSHPHWQIDPFYCDFYGYNATGNPNGFLRRG